MAEEQTTKETVGKAADIAQVVAPITAVVAVFTSLAVSGVLGKAQRDQGDWLISAFACIAAGGAAWLVGLLIPEPVEQPDAGCRLLAGGERWFAAVRRQEFQRATRSLLVVMAGVDAEHVLQMTAVEDEDPVEAVGADGAHPALGEGVRVRGLDRRADHLDALRAEDLVEGVAELRVAVVDEESERVLVAELHEQVARLLGDLACVRVRAAGDVLDPPGSERDEEEHVDPLQEDGLDREEVAGEHDRRLRL
jgi:hypothetical protein